MKNLFLASPTSAENQSLSRRFSFNFSIVIVSITLVFSLIVIIYNYFRVKDELDNQLADTVKLAETSLSTAVWQMDISSMDDILGAILVNDNIASVRILLEDEVVAQKTQPRYSHHPFSTFENSTQFDVESVAVKRVGETVGVFEVAISRADIQRSVFITIIVVIGLLMVLCLAILVTSMIITRRYIFRPLMRIQSHAKMIAGGNLDSTVEADGTDEFAQLASSLNVMANTLKISFDTLEQKVMERTADLYLAKTEAEKMNQHLGVLSAELKALLDNSPMGIIFADFDRVIHRVNPETTRITGYSVEELIGQKTRILYGSDEQYRMIGETYYPILREHGFCQMNAKIRKKDGTDITCSWRGRMVVAEGGIEGVVWSLEDISMRLKMENELLKAKKLESIGVFAGGIAHDFNNLLLAILGNISLAKRITPPNGQLQELLDSAQKASERAKDLTVKLLTFASGGEPVRAKESLPQLLKESASFVLSGSNVKCTYSLPDDLWSVNMDKSQINQVIQNLVLNADQAMPKGGLIHISCENVLTGYGEVPGLVGGRYVLVRVGDSGSGISAENLERIFDPYFSTKEKDSNKGSGLGLAIVHSIILKHGGAITVESSPGEGSTFSIYLPAMQGEAVSQSGSEEYVAEGRGSILVMDDEKIIRDVVCQMLEHLGYQASESEDGQEAVDRYREHIEKGKRFDAVIMDLTIPGGMGGAEAVKEIISLDPQAKVIVSSGYSQDPILDDYKTFGFSNIVRKPYQLVELSMVLDATLKG